MVSVVLVHGIRTSATMWRDQSRRLTAAGIEHTAVDLPGHGSRVDESFTLESCRRVLDEVVGSMPAPCVVVGMSLGSYVALDWAASSARPPAALVLASCGAMPRGAALRGYIGVAGLIGRLPDRGLALHTRLATALLGREVGADLCAGGVALEAMVPTLRAVRDIDMLGALDVLRVPIWFVNGSWDHFRLHEGRLVRAAWRSTLVVVPRAGHLFALERPSEFAEMVGQVVAQEEAASRAETGQQREGVRRLRGRVD